MRQFENLKTICLFCGLLPLQNCLAQQPVQWSLYLFNNYLINPAITGSVDHLDIKLGYRTQWLGFGAAPQTYFVSAHTPMSNHNMEFKPFGERNHHGVGGYLIKDATGPISRIGGYLSYAYHLHLTHKINAALGVSAGAIQYSLDGASMKTADPDPDITSINAITPDANAGIWVYTEKYFAGFSAQQLMPLTLGGTNTRLNNTFFLTGGYAFKINESATIIPAAHVKFGLLTPVSFDVSVKYDWEQRYWGGITYRKVEGILAFIGFNIFDMFDVGYAFDFTLSTLRNYSSYSHEIIVGFRVPKKHPETNRCPVW